MSNVTAQNVTPISTTTTNQEIDYEALMQVDANDIFPEVITEPGKMFVNMREHRHPACKDFKTHYEPDLEKFKQVMLWLMAPNPKLTLGLVGETGTGKTDMIEYIADRLNIPLYKEQITSGMKREHLEGGYDLVNDGEGNMKSVKRYSQASLGYIHGGIVLLDEIDKANDELSTALHPFLEGKLWTNATFSETYVKHDTCRVMVTGNTTGDGTSDRYITSQKLDQAIRRRIGWITLEYPDMNREFRIMSKEFENLPELMLRRMVKTANALRVALLGPEGNGDGEINCPFSTGNLYEWCYWTLVYGAERTPRQSFDFSFAGCVDEDDKADVEAILQSVWGEDINKPSQYFIDLEENGAPK